MTQTHVIPTCGKSRQMAAQSSTLDTYPWLVVEILVNANVDDESAALVPETLATNH